MPSWLVGTIVVIVLFAIALFREGKRVGWIKEWCRSHGFVEHRQMPDDLNAVIREATAIFE